MIKGRIDLNDGRGSLLLIGLSGENVARLIAGEPIRIGSAELLKMGFYNPDPILIVYGKTEDSLLAELTKNRQVDRLVDFRKGEAL